METKNGKFEKADKEGGEWGSERRKILNWNINPTYPLNELNAT